MPTCSVLNCSNSTRKRLSMHKFPRDPKRRELWAKMINKPSWKLKDSSVLCEVHFAEDAWEKLRVDGKKKLKFNAVPTIFSENTNKNLKIVRPSQNILKRSPVNNVNPQVSLNGTPVVITKPMETKFLNQIPAILKTEKVLIPENSDDPDEISLFDPDDPVDIPLFDPHNYAMALKKEPEGNSEFKYVPEVELSKKNIDQEREETLQCAERLKRCEKILAKTEKSRINLKNNLKTLTAKLKRLEEVTDESKVLSRLKTVFNDDQMRALCRDGRSRVIWSDATMEKALKLRLTCGEAGYSELIRQNIPLPSLRNLRRALQVSRFTNRFSKEVIEFLQLEFQNVKNCESDGTEELKEEIKN